MQNSLGTPAAAAIERAQLLARAGDLKGAAELCRGVVAREPKHFYALFMLGTLESQFGEFGQAEKHLARAVKLEPRSAEALTLYGNVLIEKKQQAEAISVLSRALAIQPQNSHALLYRGLAYAETGKHDEAIQDFDRVLRLDPRSVFALHNRATSLIALKRHKEARPNVEALLRIAPAYVPALANQARLLLEDGKHEEALAVLHRALAGDANNPDLINARGTALMKLGRHEEALAAFRRVTTLKADAPDAHLNAGNMLMELGRLDDALAETEKSIAVQTDYAPALLMRANALQHLGRTAEAFAAYDKTIAVKPDYADAYYHRGSALLLHGRFAEGWRDFEWRWKVTDCGFDRPLLRAAEWRGENLAGKSVIVYSEQGLGDAIQFARFLPRLTERGARLTFLCHPGLVHLFRTLAGEMEVIALSQPDRRFDFQCALMSLPQRFGIGLEDLPGQVPYIFADAGRIESWRARLGESGFKIGIGWQGNPKGLIDKGRSIPLAKFAPLAGVPGVRLISLQKTHGLEQLARLPGGMTVETLGVFDEGPDAFVDTAAIMRSLDLVITSDTATAHLAGALGVPVWVALKQMPDWRWMLGRSDSPWYPTMRVFRQARREDWDSVFADIAEALRLLGQRGTP